MVQVGNYLPSARQPLHGAPSLTMVLARSIGVKHALYMSCPDQKLITASYQFGLAILEREIWPFTKRLQVRTSRALVSHPSAYQRRRDKHGGKIVGASYSHADILKLDPNRYSTLREN